MPRTRKPKTIEDLRRKFPLGATVYFKGEPVGTVCGYKRWINDSYENEPEVLYVNWRVHRDFASKIGQFTVRSPNFKSKPFRLVAYTRHHSGIGMAGRRELTVYFNPAQQFLTDRTWWDVTNGEWAIWEEDLHRVVR